MNRKNLFSAVLFLLLMALTFYTILKGNDMKAVWGSILELNPVWLSAAVLTALFFVCAEGIMIWYLLRALGSRISPLSCVKFSFIGFFYSGITPSATGGQPMQLYYMKKSGLRISDSTVVLMAVALAYKLVLVILGIGMLIFWNEPLHYYLSKYIYLYYLGLFLNVVLVAVLIFVMISPRCFGKLVSGGESVLIRLHILKHSEERAEKLNEMIASYHEAVLFFLKHTRHVVIVTAFTFLQRLSIFFLTWLIYKGMHLSGHDLLSVMIIQGAVYVAVDMLPLPGAQGITELMYKTVFAYIFPGACLTASMCVTRGLNFYLLFIISGLTAAFAAFTTKRAVSK